MDRAVDVRRRGRGPNALSALAAIVSPDHRRRGLSAEVLRATRSLAREDGSAFDPWLRLHHGLVAQPLKLMPKFLTVSGTAAE